MEKRISTIFILSLFALFILTGGALAATKSTDTFKASKVLPLDGGQPSQTYSSPSPLMYEGSKDADCEDIDPIYTGPTSVPVTVIQHDQWAMTFYDYQKNGSMGRMIAVDQGGHRGMVMHETRGPYSALYPRWITYNCKNALDSWLFGQATGQQIDGGIGINAGYVNIALMHDGREVVIYHTTGEDEDWGTRLAISDEGWACNAGNVWDAQYDIPDGSGATELGMWPKVAVKYDATVDTDYIHVVMTEGKTSGGNQRLLYVRCHVLRDANPTTSDPLFCETPVPNGDTAFYVIPPHSPSGGLPQTRKVAHFGECQNVAGQYPNTISVIPVTSPVSKKVAIVFTNKREAGNGQVNNDVFYFQSTNNGVSWFPQYGGTWPPTAINVTNYLTTSSERAYTDVAATYDYNDNLHIVWNAGWLDSAQDRASVDANLYHWSQATGISFIAPGYWDKSAPGGWNRNVSKMSVSAKDPIYHPGGTPDSVYLFVTWTQFNGDNMPTLDNSKSDMTNGDIYAAVSANAGQTWTPSYNLTNTHTDTCSPGNCLSEHWSSLAENMYNGDLHISYVCDKDPGGAIQNEGKYTDNPMMYLHVNQLPWKEGCGLFYTDLNPPSFTTPPLKVWPSPGTRNFTVKLKGIYNKGGDYAVTSDNLSKVTIETNPTGHLEPNQSTIVTGTVHCSGQELIQAHVLLKGCIGQPEEKTISLPLYAVCSNDYYECMRDAKTKYGSKNGVCSLWVSANTSQELFDLRLPRDSNDQVIFYGGVIAATITPAYLGSDTIVVRQDYRDTKTGARDTLNVYTVDEDSPGKCKMRRVCVDNTFVWYPDTIPQNPKWYWIDIRKQAITFENKTGYTCDAWRRAITFKQVWIKWNRPPAWWPSPGTYQGHNDIYYGVYADVDAPFDTGGNGYNWAGWDNTNKIMWQRGWTHGTSGQHPAFDDHYVGLAFTDKDGNKVDPYGAHDVLNREYLYPNGGWGWQDSQLYRLASTAGTSIDVTSPDSALDRSMVLTAGKIAQGRDIAAADTLFVGSFILIEASDPGPSGGGLASLQTHINDARGQLIPILRKKGLFGRCGDANCDGDVNGADVSFLINYLFVGGPKTCWPADRADVNWDHKVAGNDASYLINYLFVGGPKPRCPGLEYY